ncbi:MAG: hypothetical protein U0Q16_07465 [Bryobacteraceae bacterium]
MELGAEALGGHPGIGTEIPRSLKACAYTGFKIFAAAEESNARRLNAELCPMLFLGSASTAEEDMRLAMRKKSRASTGSCQQPDRIEWQIDGFG